MVLISLVGESGGARKKENLEELGRNNGLNVPRPQENEALHFYQNLKAL
ncbi:hypothetical protein A2U01_0068424, partial [Trifolium medium]|nr:hypothetical protein [Trifolium medium]